MFNKLKIRLLMIHLILLSAVLVIIFAAMYLFIKKGYELQSMRLLKFFLLIGVSSLIPAALASSYLSGRALNPLKEAWAKQKDLVADASHELRTPLAVIRTNLEVVRGNPGETVESQNKWLDNIAYESQMIEKLVNDLLFLTRSGLQEGPPQMMEFSLSKAMHHAIIPFEPVCAGKGIALHVKITPEVSIWGYEGGIKQLVAILLDNAIKHTPEKGRIVLELSESEDAAQITVADTGEGIPNEHLNNIFKRFFRVESGYRGKYGGSGLGLAIAERIVKEHHGSIKVFSSMGEGSEFKVSLPKALENFS